MYHNWTCNSVSELLRSIQERRKDGWNEVKQVNCQKLGLEIKSEAKKVEEKTIKEENSK